MGCDPQIYHFEDTHWKIALFYIVKININDGFRLNNTSKSFGGQATSSSTNVKL